MTNKTLKGGENMLRLIATITIFVSTAYAQVVWMNYNSTGCITCHRIASVKMSDTLYIFGTFHYNNKLNPFLIAVDSSLNVKWYKAFSHSLGNAAIDKMVKINDSLIAISGGHTSRNFQCQNYNCTFFGIFNIKTQNFVWAKYRQADTNYWHMSATAIDFDGNNLVIGAQSTMDTYGSWLLKVNLSGSIQWQKIIYRGPQIEFSVMDVIFDGANYVYLFRSGVSGGDNISLVKLDLNGNLKWAKDYDFGKFEYPYKLLRDANGYVVVGFKCQNGNCSHPDSIDNILIFKTDTAGNILWSKLYSSNIPGWLRKYRAYNIAFDYDGNYLVSGFVRATSTSSYPIVLKINRNDGNLIWARYWDTPPSNTNSDRGAGVISIGQGKFYLLTFIGSGVDASGGFAIIREDTARADGGCTKSLSMSVSSQSPTVSTLSVTISSATYTVNNLSLSPYNPTINQTLSCQITPISNYEYIKSCDYEIKPQRNYIEINLKRKKNVYIYNVLGKVVYRDEFEGRRRIKLKDGIYVIKLDNEKFKVVVK
jgi:hypothetical protein